MGVDVQAISTSPFQFMYWLDPELGRRTAHTAAGAAGKRAAKKNRTKR
jgi:hypothetical protein